MNSDSSTLTSNGHATSNNEDTDGGHTSPTFVLDTLKAEALRLGFSACGAAPADAVALEHARVFTDWLADGRQAGMEYLRNYVDLRLDPRRLMPGARTVVSVALSYYPRQTLRQDQYQFAYYAYGKDYHDVMRDRLRRLATQCLPDAECRICVDTAPVLERYWAVQAGLGWIGRNKTLIVPKVGSFVFLGEIITDAVPASTPAASPTSPVTAPSASVPQYHCGNCHRCLDACPACALAAVSPTDTSLDARRCLSYLTIEHRGKFLDEIGYFASQDTSATKYIYGCDRCQLCCPHNQRAAATSVDEFAPSQQFLSMTKDDWHNLTREQYQQLFRGSAVKRVKYEGLVRNIGTVARLPADGQSECPLSSEL